MIICRAHHRTVWDGRGFNRRHRAGLKLLVFRDVSPYPADEGLEVYGVATYYHQCKFERNGAPMVFYSLEDAVSWANGKTEEEFSGSEGVDAGLGSSCSENSKMF